MAGLVHNFNIDLRYRRQLRRDRVIRDRRHPLEIYDDVELVERFRFSRIKIYRLTDVIRAEIEHNSNCNATLSAVQQVLIALRFYATGCYQSLSGDALNVHRTTACRAIRNVSLALGRRLGQNVYLPDDAEYIANTKAKFQEIGGFPNVIGCIDGTHVRIQKPATHEWEYVNRKGFHSLNVQLVCDADLRIVNAVVKWPGSTHDARMLTESTMYRHFEESEGDRLLLGDSAYPQKHWLMTPFLRPTNNAQERYNNVHKVTRSVIERCNGVLKARFACILGKLLMSPRRATTVVAAVIVLHNICINKRLPLPENAQPPALGNPDIDAADIDLEHHVNVRGNVKRLQIVQNYFT